MKEIKKLQEEIEKEEHKINNLVLHISAQQGLLDAMEAAQETRKNMLEAYKALQQVNNN